MAKENVNITSNQKIAVIVDRDKSRSELIAEKKKKKKGTEENTKQKKTPHNSTLLKF